MGVPGLKPAQAGVDAEIDALRKGIASIYPNINGSRNWRKRLPRFIKAFINVDVPAECCVPVTGSMQERSHRSSPADSANEVVTSILFIDPGFPSRSNRLSWMGLSVWFIRCIWTSRCRAFRDELRSISPPERLLRSSIPIPTTCPGSVWRGIADHCWCGSCKYDVIIIEGFCLFRHGFPARIWANLSSLLISRGRKLYRQLYSGRSPDRKPSVMLDSVSAWQLISINFITEHSRTDSTLWWRNVWYPSISTAFFACFIRNKPFSTMCLAAMFKAASDGTFNFVEQVREYGRRAAKLKRGSFKHHGFYRLWSRYRSRHSRRFLFSR